MSSDPSFWYYEGAHSFRFTLARSILTLSNLKFTSFTMKFPISTIKFLARLPSHNDDTVSADDEARWNGISTGSFNDPFTVPATDL